MDTCNNRMGRLCHNMVGGGGNRFGGTEFTLLFFLPDFFEFS